MKKFYHGDGEKKKNFEPSLNNIQKNLIFEDQIRVTLNLWTPLPLANIIKKSESKDEIDFLAPLAVVNGLSFANFIINEPNAITTMNSCNKIINNRSIIQQFSVFMKKITKKNGKFKDCYEELESALPDDKGWIRK